MPGALLERREERRVEGKVEDDGALAADAHRPVARRPLLAFAREPSEVRAASTSGQGLGRFAPVRPPRGRAAAGVAPRPGGASGWTRGAPRRPRPPRGRRRAGPRAPPRRGGRASGRSRPSLRPRDVRPRRARRGRPAEKKEQGQEQDGDEGDEQVRHDELGADPPEQRAEQRSAPAGRAPTTA